MQNNIVISTKKLANKKVWFSRPRKNDPDAVKKLGRIRAWVFHPKDLKCVGFLVKRPDLALMFHRQDTFVAFNGFDLIDGDIVIRNDKNSKDKSACKALCISLDDCVIWIGMPVMTKNGTTFGVVDNVDFRADTGEIEAIDVSQGATANTLLGHRRIPAKEILGFKRGMGTRLYTDDEDSEDSLGAILVSDSVKQSDVKGGIAEKAGAASAVVANKAKKSAEKMKPQVKKATEAAGQAVNKGAYLTGRQISRASGMFGKFKDEFNKAMNSDDDE